MLLICQILIIVLIHGWEDFGTRWYAWTKLGADQNWTHVAHTDANGNYVVTDLEPGVYNIAVIMEDEKFQDITFRPDSKPTAVSRSVYVSGFAPLTLQADGAGNGMSALVWSEG